jgi:hypothetical protein
MVRRVTDRFGLASQIFRTRALVRGTAAAPLQASNLRRWQSCNKAAINANVRPKTR